MGTSWISGGWSDGDKQIVTDLWSQGYSASQIARKIGKRYTRSAVLGVINRMGLPKRGPNTSRLVTPRAPRLKNAPLITAPAPQQQNITPDPASLVSITDAEYWHCRWPMTEVHPIEEFRYCGRARMPGKTYCEGHIFESLPPRKIPQ